MRLLKVFYKDVPAEKQMMLFSLATLYSPSLLIDEQIPEILHTIRHKNIPIMALTANLTGRFAKIENMQQWRINDLQQLGIDFTLSAPFKKPLLFDDLKSYRNNYSTYTNGVLFVNGVAVSKGETLLSFLNKTGLKPNKIIFIDDREENLKSLENAINKLDYPIVYQGIHFLGAYLYPSKRISEEEFTTKWRALVEHITYLD